MFLHLGWIRVFRPNETSIYIYYAEIEYANRVAARMVTQMFASDAHIFICFANCWLFKEILPNRYIPIYLPRREINGYADFRRGAVFSPTGRTRFRMPPIDLGLDGIGGPRTHLSIRLGLFYP